MRLLQLVFSLILAEFAVAGGIANGEYEITFLASNDNIETQIVTVTNLKVLTPGSDPSLEVLRFDLIITKEGSFNRSDSHRQFVPGVVWLGKFKFVIPSERMTHVSSYSFEGSNVEKDGVMEGIVDIPDPDGGRMKKKFWMKRVPSDQPPDGNR